jgi:Domain of unknown function (DUF2405)
VNFKDVPIISLCFDSCEIIFDDSKFEAALTRNYCVGFQQNRERNAVEYAFVKAAKARGVEFSDVQSEICGFR